MTWNEIYEVGKIVARNDGGTQYRAMEYFALSPYNQLSATFVDPKTNKSLYNTPEWKKLIETWGQFYKIPGSSFKTTTYSTIEQMFLKDGTLAMLVSPFNNPFTGISSMGEARNQFNWDMVTMPVFSEKPKTGATDIPNHVMIAKQSKHKDEAFLVVETMLSDEVQSDMSRGGIVPVLKSQKVKDEFLKGVEFAKGKNVSAVFKLEHAPARVPSIYDGKVSSVYNTIAKDYYSGKKDINTVLREAEEESNKRIDAEIAQRSK
jgi:multiple sugar transport system substrate-binding protein